MHELPRDGLEPERYAYLSIADSELYDRVRKSRNGKDLEIKRLLEDKAFDVVPMITTLGVRPMTLADGLIRTFHMVDLDQ